MERGGRRNLGSLCNGQSACTTRGARYLSPQSGPSPAVYHKTGPPTPFCTGKTPMFRLRIQDVQDQMDPAVSLDMIEGELAKIESLGELVAST